MLELLNQAMKNSNQPVGQGT